MPNLEYKTDDLLDIIRANREAHTTIFNEAVEGYRKQAVVLLEEHIARIQQGKLVRVAVSLPLPENHVEDYDQIIKQIEMAKIAGAATIELDDFEFQSYVMDRWTWKNQFLTSNSSYSQTAAAALR